MSCCKSGELLPVYNRGARPDRPRPLLAFTSPSPDDKSFARYLRGKMGVPPQTLAEPGCGKGRIGHMLRPSLPRSTWPGTSSSRTRGTTTQRWGVFAVCGSCRTILVAAGACFPDTERYRQPWRCPPMVWQPDSLTSWQLKEPWDRRINSCPIVVVRSANRTLVRGANHDHC